VKTWICEVCVVLYSPETANELEYLCIYKDGKLIEIEVDEAKTGHLIDKEVKALRKVKESYAFNHREGYDGASVL